MGSQASKTEAKAEATVDAKTEAKTELKTVSKAESAAKAVINQMMTRKPKIDMAAIGMIKFLKAVMNLHDRCSVSAFNHEYHQLETLADERDCVACMAVLTQMCTGSTTLYDAIVVSIIQFALQANRSRPWILIVLTDGEDTGSKSSLQDAAEALAAFNKPRNNYAFIIGIGNDVKTKEMQHLAKGGDSLYVALEDSKVLPALFACMALQVQTGVEINISNMMHDGAESIFARVQQAPRLAREPVDILILCDVSGSMKADSIYTG